VQRVVRVTAWCGGVDGSSPLSWALPLSCCCVRASAAQRSAVSNRVAAGWQAPATSSGCCCGGLGCHACQPLRMVAAVSPASCVRQAWWAALTTALRTAKSLRRCSVQALTAAAAAAAAAAALQVVSSDCRATVGQVAGGGRTREAHAEGRPRLLGRQGQAQQLAQGAWCGHEPCGASPRRRKPPAHRSRLQRSADGPLQDRRSVSLPPGAPVACVVPAWSRQTRE